MQSATFKTADYTITKTGSHFNKVFLKAHHIEQAQCSEGTEISMGFWTSSPPPSQFTNAAKNMSSEGFFCVCVCFLSLFKVAKSSKYTEGKVNMCHRRKARWTVSYDSPVGHFTNARFVQHGRQMSLTASCQHGCPAAAAPAQARPHGPRTRAGRSVWAARSHQGAFICDIFLVLVIRCSDTTLLWMRTLVLFITPTFN